MQVEKLEQINNAAREWFTLMQSGSVNETDRQACTHWLQENRAHQEAYRQYEIIWQELGNLAGSK